MSNLIKLTRIILGLTQLEFGIWLAKEDKRDNPFSESRISEWENGKYSPRKNIRDICIPIVAKSLANDAVAEVAKCFGKDVTKKPLTPDLRTVRDDIKEWIEAIA